MRDLLSDQPSDHPSLPTGGDPSAGQPPYAYPSPPPPGQVWPPPPGGAQAPMPLFPTPTNAVLILVLGILSLVICAICGPFAWVMGNASLKAIDQGLANPVERSMVNAGRICGIVGTGFLGLGVVYYLALFIFGLVSSVGTHR